MADLRRDSEGSWISESACGCLIVAIGGSSKPASPQIEIGLASPALTIN